ncbi:M18 family aminopeptidase [Clostridium frigidicarnis]|uniref:M18 family aminopeptidase n=1 Tax=Clostridium frigidicarnis TaxID=84698 RepID=A0A1I0YY88_9CLOT|nr:M18 family aminopeptidase [Clostridium frigidicarnis]SFB18017.1 aspartyl aminopeptidase [Clostridium frigidicarnis]
MNNELKFAEELIDFLYESPTAFHAVESIKKVLDENDFEELKEENRWNIKHEGKYYVTKNQSALIAFVIGKGDVGDNGFKIVGAHTDSPTFRIKPNPEIMVEDNYVKLNTEVYGGPILSTWFDRPLSIAGRVTLKSENPLNPNNQLININKPILIIPNIAIHMNREVNDGFKINRQKDTLPLISLVNDKLEKGKYLLNLLAQELKVNMDDIIDFDLFLYEYEKGTIMGLNNEFISMGRQDDLSMVHAGIKALINSKINMATNVMVCFDNEEVGSSTKQGGDSNLLVNILERIALCLGEDKEDFFRAIAKSFMISADLAHALHPNYIEKNDPTVKCFINKGPVIKINANQAYTSDSDSIAVYEQICRRAKVPVQKFVNRSDLRGGSTIGPISSTHLPIRSIDIGNPVFSMHSIRELGGVLDHMYILKSFEEYYNL